jgi:hypothetical protein
VRALGALAGAGVEFVEFVVGGINFYARTPAQAFATLDLDALLPPAADNLALALRVPSEIGYAFETGAEPVVDLDDAKVLGQLVRNGAHLCAIHPEAGQLDLMTSIAGFSYADLVADATRFTVAGVEVRVGRLEKLLRSKQASGRPKDHEFLRAFEAAATDDEVS